jgi:hypothetical protein
LASVIQAASMAGCHRRRGSASAATAACWAAQACHTAAAHARAALACPAGESTMTPALATSNTVIAPVRSGVGQTRPGWVGLAHPLVGGTNLDPGEAAVQRQV